MYVLWKGLDSMSECCEKCDKEYDPSEGGDTEQVEALMYFADIDGVCLSCLDDMKKALEVAANDFLYEVD